MDQQTWINITVTIIIVLGGWLFTIMWNLIKNLQQSQETIISENNSLKVLVAGNYVKREEFTTLTNRIFDKLDSIENKLDMKADKK